MFGLGDDSAAVLKTVFETNCILEFTADGKSILRANANFLTMTGYAGQDLVGKAPAALITFDDGAGSELSQMLEAALAGKTIFSELRLRHKDGADIWVNGRLYPIQKGKRRTRIILFATDITKSRAERRHADSVIAAIDRSQATIEFDLQGIIKTANENFLKTVGYSLEEIRGKHHRMFVAPEEASSAAYADFWGRLRNGEFFVAEYRRIGKGGKEVWIQASYNAMKDASGHTIGVIKFATDITAEHGKRSERTDLQKIVNAGVENVATAIAGTSRQATGAAAAAVQASSNVNAVAAGASQLASSVTEINIQVGRALEISNEAVSKAEMAGGTVTSLVEDANKINAVVDLISSIASQTNLLALNATIEAARAGEAGKGFAVVASEVKELASQTARATGEINARIAAVQASSLSAKGAIEAIASTISDINGISVSISAAVEEQAAVTADMSHNMQEAAKGVGMITQTMEEVAQLTQEAHRGVGEIQQASRRVV